ncbi:MAG: ribonuclease HII [Bacteroidetes bacterium]|nr:ribonuclease HII [Bacteroidota bacterium]
MKSWYKKGIIEAGCDEAGRGCLAGPVFAAAVILPLDFYCSILNDSKKLPEKIRYLLRDTIKKEAVTYAVAMVDNNEIDDLNILNASFLAMHLAINQLIIKPGFLIIDGNRFKAYPSIPHRCIVGGDGKYLSIAAASVLAKTYRDDYMIKLHRQYKNYGWDKNKGYPTRKHREAIAKFGITSCHRKSFRLLAD